MSKAPTSTGMYPLRPSRRLSADDPLVIQGILQEGELAGYTRDPSAWLPEFTLEAKPLVKPSEVCYNRKVQGTKPTRKKRNTKMENVNTETETTTEDVRSDEQKAPRKRDAAPKAKKEKAPPKPSWEPSEGVTAALNAISAIDHFDKKGIAQIVKAAIELRTEAKVTRERAEEFPTEDASATSDDSAE